MLLMPARRLVLKAVKPGETQISGIVFDMDGTLTKPQSYMFKQMRQALGIVGKKVDILDYIGRLDGDKKIIAAKKVEDVENQAMIDMKPQNGVNTLFHFMRENTNLKFTICTRNNIAPVDYLLEHYLDGLQLNDPIITVLKAKTTPLGRFRHTRQPAAAREIRTGCQEREQHGIRGIVF